MKDFLKILGIVALGLVLIALEVFVIPGFGVAGIAVLAGLLAEKVRRLRVAARRCPGPW